MKKLLLEFEIPEVLNLINSLEFYKNNGINKSYSENITRQIEKIEEQLLIQNFNIIQNDTKPMFNFGEKVLYQNKPALITGMSSENEFIEIAIIDNSELTKIEVPIVLTTKIPN